jgi:hypothetical protein
VCAGRPDWLIPAYRQAPGKQADEPGWRTKGQKGSAWLCATPRLRLFLCRQTRAASGPQPVVGKCWLLGCLVVDRDGGSHKVPCAIQDGYSHVWREVQARETEVPAVAEVTAWGRTVAPQRARALGRRAHPRSDAEFARQAAALKAPLLPSREAPAPHLGLRRLPERCRANVDRLAHGAADQRLPAEPNRAERARRPTVIARQVSVGSPAEAGAHTRGVRMSVLQTLKKRGGDVVAPSKGGWTDSPMISSKAPGHCFSQKAPPETEGLLEVIHYPWEMTSLLA